MSFLGYVSYALYSRICSSEIYLSKICPAVIWLLVPFGCNIYCSAPSGVLLQHAFKAKGLCRDHASIGNFGPFDNTSARRWAYLPERRKPGSATIFFRHLLNLSITSLGLLQTLRNRHEDKSSTLEASFKSFL